MSEDALTYHSLEEVIHSGIFDLTDGVHGVRVLLDFSNYTVGQQLRTQAMLLTGGISMLMEFVQVRQPS